MKLHDCPMIRFPSCAICDQPYLVCNRCTNEDGDVTRDKFQNSVADGCPCRRLYSVEQVSKYVYGFWAKYEKFPTERDVTDPAKGIAAWAEREENPAMVFGQGSG